MKKLTIIALIAISSQISAGYPESQVPKGLPTGTVSFTSRTTGMPQTAEELAAESVLVEGAPIISGIAGAGQIRILNPKLKLEEGTYNVTLASAEFMSRGTYTLAKINDKYTLALVKNGKQQSESKINGIEIINDSIDLPEGTYNVQVKTGYFVPNPSESQKFYSIAKVGNNTIVLVSAEEVGSLIGSSAAGSYGAEIPTKETATAKLPLMGRGKIRTNVF